LGRGACATVCALESIDNINEKNNDNRKKTCETDFAIKLAPLPVKSTKKGNSPDETNAKLLYYEQMIYSTQFRSLQGSLIPKVPNFAASKDPPLYGDESGFRFFVMERMEDTISAIVPLLLQSKSIPMPIPIGPIAVKLLECVRAVHDTKNIIRDVKTENFMLSPAKAKANANANANAKAKTQKSATTTATTTALASRIRLIDLAIATQWTTMYCETEDGGSLVGTPLYASLHVHEGKKTSFRDDLESLGYVIAEILTQLHAGDPSKQLPWSCGTSDEDIAARKRSMVEDHASDFYRQMGDDATVRVFSNYLRIVRGYAFKKVPDYEELSAILSKLTVPALKTSLKSKTKANAKTKTKAKAKACTGVASAASKCGATKQSASTKRIRNSNSNSEDEDEDEDEDEEYASPPKVARRSTRKKNNGADSEMTIEDLTNEEDQALNENDQSFDETVYADAHQDMDEMDWEYTNHTNHANSASASASASDENEQPGPVEESDSNPRTRSRARRDPASKTRTQRVAQRVTRSRKATISTQETIVIDSENSEQEQQEQHKQHKQHQQHKQQQQQQQQAFPNKLQRRGVLIVCTEGPHKGESYEMEAGANDTIVLGSDPSSKVGQLFSLGKDKGLKKTHVRLDLAIHRRLTTVKVTDKSNGKTYVNRDAVKNTKAFINDVITIGETSLAIRAL